MAKAIISNINDVPEPLREHYELRGEQYVLKIEGEHPNVKDLKDTNVRLRDGTIKIMQALKLDPGTSIDATIERAALVGGYTVEQLKAFKDVNLTEYQELKAKAAALKEKGVGDVGDIDTRVNGAVAAALKKFSEDTVAPLQKKLDTTEKAREEANEKLREKSYRDTVSTALTKAGARADALEFLVGKSKEFLKYDPEAETVEPKGDKFDEQGQPVKLDSWVKLAVKEHGFAFVGSGGGGAKGGDGNGKGFNKDGKTLVLHGQGPADPAALGAAVDLFEKGQLDRVQHR